MFLYFYYRNHNLISMIIDVSSHNGKIDFAKAKAAGVETAIVRASLGYGDKDNMLETNAQGFANVGVAVSYYHFAYPDAKRGGTVVSDAATEAEYFVNTVAQLPPYVRLWVDLENWDAKGKDSPLSPADYQLWLTTFLGKIKELTGKDAGIYTYKSYFDTHLPAGHPFGDFKLWIANYSAKVKPPIPKGFKKYYLWQYSDSGSVAGIIGKVDLNKLNTV